MSPKPPQPEGLGRPSTKGERTAERILDAAEALFAEHGFAGTTLRDVATAVGLRNPSLYNHFGSKEALYAAVLERGIEPIMAALSEAVAAQAEGEADPSSIVESIIRQLAARPNLSKLVFHETLSGGQRLTPMLRGWIGPALETGQSVVRANPDAQHWSDEQIPLLVLALYHVVVGYFATAPLYRELAGVDLTSDEAVARQIELMRTLVAALFPSDKGE